MTTFWWCLNVGLVCYGLGLRVSAYQHRKEARRVAAEFQAKAAELDAAITASNEPTT